MFAIAAVVLYNVLDIAMGNMGYGPLYGLYTLAVLIPGIEVAVRRIHDIGKRGWILFIILIPLAGAIWLLVVLVTDGNPGQNDIWCKSKRKHCFRIKFSSEDCVLSSNNVI